MLNLLKKLLVFIFIILSFKVVSQDKKPNVLFFLVDDLGWLDVGYQGSNIYESPTIDNLSPSKSVLIHSVPCDNLLGKIAT